MKKIHLSQNKFAIVDDDVFEYLNQWTWCAAMSSGHLRAMRADLSSNKRKDVYMHRVIMDAKDGTVVDHINGNSLDNRRENLRVCSKKENCRNRGMSKNNTSGYKGVTRKDKKFVAQIMVNKVNIYLGRYLTPEDAAIAYNKAALDYFGEFARLNFSENLE